MAGAAPDAMLTTAATAKARARMAIVEARTTYTCATVPCVDAEERGQPVEITLAVLVPDVTAVAAHEHRHLAVRKGPHAREVHPEVALGQLLEAALRHGMLGRRHAPTSLTSRSFTPLRTTVNVRPFSDINFTQRFTITSE